VRFEEVEVDGGVIIVVVLNCFLRLNVLTAVLLLFCYCCLLLLTAILLLFSAAECFCCFVAVRFCLLLLAHFPSTINIIIFGFHSTSARPPLHRSSVGNMMRR
jgi:hypothetical protein